MSRRLEAGLWRWIDFSRRRAVPVTLVLVVLSVVGLALAITGLGVNTDTRQMIAPDKPFRQASATFEAAFPALSDQRLIVIQGPSPDAVDRAAAALTETLPRRPAINSVFAPRYDDFFEENGLLFLKVDELEQLLARLTRAAPLIERLNANPSLDGFFDALAEAASAPDTSTDDAETIEELFTAVAKTIEARLDDTPLPLSWQSLFQGDGEEKVYQAVLTVEPVLDTTLLRPAKPAVADIEAETARIITDIDPSVSISVTGGPALRSDELQTVREGSGVALLISAVLVLTLLLIAYRSLALALLTIAAIFIAVAITSGLAALLFEGLNLVSVAFVVLMVGLGADFGIHLALHIRAHQSEPLTPRPAFYRTIREIGTALALTAPTTALAFFAFSPTDFVGMGQMGILGGLGVLVAFAVAMSLLSAIIPYLPHPKKPVAGLPIPRGEKGVRIIGVGVLVLGVLALPLLPQARFDADPMALRNPDSPSVKAFGLLFASTDTVPYRLNILVPQGDGAAALADEIGNLPEVDSVRYLGAFIPDNQQAKLDLLDYAGIGLAFAVEENPPAQPLADDPGEALQRALATRDGPAAARLREVLEEWGEAERPPAARAALEADLLRYWPDQLGRLRKQLGASLITQETLPADLSDRYLNADGLARIEVIPAANVQDAGPRRQFVDAVVAIAPDATGSARNVLEAGATIQTAMIQASLLAGILVSIFLLLILRDGRLVLSLILTLGVAGVLTTATGTLLDMPYNFANVIVLPLLVGIGVDSGIHLALRTARSQSVAGVTNSVTARAVFFSALTTIACFGSLSFSDHRGTASMGALLMIAIGWTLVTTIYLLPLVVEATRKRPRETPISN